MKNPVAKNMNKFNRAETQRDKKKDQKLGYENEHYDLERLGKIIIDKEMMRMCDESTYNQIQKFIKNECVIHSTDYKQFPNRVEYLASSEHFREIDPHMTIPYYNLIVSLERDKDKLIEHKVHMKFVELKY